MRVLGIDIGGGSVKAVAHDQNAPPSVSDHYNLPDADTIVGAIRQALIPLGRPDAVGVCVPGLLSREKSRVELSVNLPGLMTAPIADLVERALGTPVPVRVLNDADAAAFHIWHTHRPPGRLLGLSIGTGVGGSVIDPDGTPLDLGDGGPGHIGQLDVTIAEPDREPPLGPDGGRGGLEAYVGSAALIARFGEDPATRLERFCKEDVPLQALARALRICHAIYRPEQIVLLGGLGIRLGPALDRLRALVDSDLTSVARSSYSLFVGENDHHAAYGAAAFATSGCIAHD